MDFKEAYFQEFETELSELEERGVSPERAYLIASINANKKLRDILADSADQIRTQMKDE